MRLARFFLRGDDDEEDEEPEESGGADDDEEDEEVAIRNQIDSSEALNTAQGGETEANYGRRSRRTSEAS